MPDKQKSTNSNNPDALLKILFVNHMSNLTKVLLLRFFCPSVLLDRLLTQAFAERSMYGRRWVFFISHRFIDARAHSIGTGSSRHGVKV